MADKRASSNLELIGSAVLGIGFVWYFFLGGSARHAEKEKQRIYAKVAADAVEKYEIAQRNGTPMDACVQAGLVRAAYLQAKDEGNYQQWTAVEKDNCAKAGLAK